MTVLSEPIPRFPPTHIGYGKYKVTVAEWGGHIYIDFTDANYPDSYFTGGDDRLSDVILEYDGEELVWGGGLGQQSYTLSSGDIIETWDQTRIGRDVDEQNKNGFKIVSNTNIPLGSHTTPGQLFVNLEVQASTTVLSGKSFSVQEPGTQILFNANKKLIVNGTLTVNGSSANPVAFDRSGTTGSWNGVRALGLAKIFGSNCLC